jgi:ABC-type transport system involved in multi-copper enzyme maturation permease subunit
MTWVAWRLQRVLFGVAAAVGVVLIIYSVYSAKRIEFLRHQWLASPCLGGNGFAARYQSLCQLRFERYAGALNPGAYVHWFAVVPAAILGLLLGASVVASEFDLKTVRVAWTQSISRGRWFVTKVAMAIGLLVVLALPLCVVVSWWLHTSQWAPRLSTNAFTFAGWLPLTLGVFAFATTTLIGVVVRRVGWSVGAGVVVVAIVAFTMQSDVRANLVALHSSTISVTTVTKGTVSVGKPSGQAPADAWIVFDGFVPVRHGDSLVTWTQEQPWIEAVNRCPSNATSPNAYDTCLTRLGLHQVELYVPDSQYWTLQLREGGLYLVSAALVLGASFLLVRRARA